MKFDHKEFTIEGCKHTFRVAKLNPIELLSLQTQLDFSDMKQAETTFAFALEHIEVKIGESWQPVKEKGKQRYMPLNIEDDVISLNRLVMYFLTEVVKPVFRKSSGSTD